MRGILHSAPESVRASIPPLTLTGHVSVKRLQEVAMADDLIFTLDEFYHLKTCSECFRQWGDFIRDY